MSMTISIHALLAESDRHGVRVAKIDLAFLSTLSLRRATHAAGGGKDDGTISIHALLAESDNIGWAVMVPPTISIHALLAESDLSCGTSPTSTRHFYPRSPCGERRGLFMIPMRHCIFLSTLSLRRATTSQVPTWFGIPNFYPRSPCGERLRGEHHANSQQEFLSTLSLRRATLRPRPISIIA